MPFYPVDNINPGRNTEIYMSREGSFTFLGYLDKLFSDWCISSGVSKGAALGAFQYAVLTGNFKIKKIPRGTLYNSKYLTSVDVLSSSPQTEDFFYSIHNKYGAELSDYSNQDFLLSYRNIVLDRLSEGRGV